MRFNKLLIFFSFSLLSNLLVSQVEVSTFYANSKKLKEEYFIASKNDSTKIGDYKFYYESGSLFQKGEMANGKPQGYWEIFYPEGTLKTTYNFNNPRQKE